MNIQFTVFESVVVPVVDTGQNLPYLKFCGVGCEYNFPSRLTLANELVDYAAIL